MKTISLFDGSTQPVTNAELEIGQIFFLNGYGQDEHSHDRKAIYKKEQGQFGLKYHFVNLDKPQRGIKNASEIRHISRKHGIGSYFKDGEFATQEEMQLAIVAAEQNENKTIQIEQDETTQKAQAIERGKALIAAHKPADAQGYIIARFEQDESDGQSDYHGSKTIKRVMLAWTTKKRENFSELRKACLNADIQEIRQLATAPESFEHRQNYTGGGGYFLAENRYSGWVIRKVNFYNNLISDEVYLIAGTEKSFYALSNTTNAAPIVAESTKTPKPPMVPSDINIIDYSEKAIAVIGNTKPIKEILKAANGRFNPRLKDKDNNIFAGWIFSKRQREKVETIIKGL